MIQVTGIVSKVIFWVVLVIGLVVIWYYLEPFVMNMFSKNKMKVEPQQKPDEGGWVDIEKLKVKK
jgi:hypothetical protein